MRIKEISNLVDDLQSEIEIAAEVERLENWLDSLLTRAEYLDDIAKEWEQRGQVDKAWEILRKHEQDLSSKPTDTENSHGVRKPPMDS